MIARLVLNRLPTDYNVNPLLAVRLYRGFRRDEVVGFSQRTCQNVPIITLKLVYDGCLRLLGRFRRNNWDVVVAFRGLLHLVLTVAVVMFVGDIGLIVSRGSKRNEVAFFSQQIFHVVLMISDHKLQGHTA